MAARQIVTIHPDVACDMCGRRLLRGEQPDVFLSGEQRRVVCELCTPRATHEGWLRETAERAVSPRARSGQRGRSLLGKLRQRREPARPTRAAGEPYETEPYGGERTPIDDEWAAVAAAPTGEDRDWPESAETDRDWPTTAETWDTQGAQPDTREAQLDTPAASDPHAGAALTLGHAGVKRALEVFNAGEQPRRVAGVARALGAPCVKVSPAANDVVAIVVAWELCWYRYEIDLGDEAAGARVAAEGMELEQLAEEDRVANAAADERGELALL
jgi:hypothetical protein